MHSHDDELLVLAEALGEVKTKTEKLEAEFSTQARPLEAATNALSATLSGIKALQFHVIDNNLGALSARVEEMRKAVDEQVGVIALELKKADESNAAKAGQEADALRSEIAGLQAQLGTLGAQFEAQLARVEFAAKEEAKKLQLIPGPAGEAGASLNPRGTFIDGQTYNRLDVVSWLGSSYIATVDGVTEKPSKTSTQWQVLASRGNGGGGTASLNDMLGAPSAGTIVGSEGSSYVRKTLVAGANIAISETPSTITITGSEGQISLEDGSAAAPSLFFTNDPDTGIYRPGSNQLGISLGGSAQAMLTSTTFTVTPNLVVSGTGTSSIGGNATVTGTLTVNNPVVAQGTAITGYQFLAKDTGGTAVGAAYALQTSGGTDKWRWGLRGSAGSLTDSLIFSYLSGSWSDALTLSNAGVVSIPATTASTSTSTGALVVSGGVGVAGAMNVGGVITTDAEYLQGSNVNFNIRSTATNGNVYLKSNGGTLYLNNTAGNGDIRLGNTGNVVTVVGTTASTSTSTGALVVSGGVGVAGAAYVGGNATVFGTAGITINNVNGLGNDSILTLTQSGVSNAFIKNTATTGDIAIGDGGGTYLRITKGVGVVSLLNTSASTSTSSGALVVSGGVGVAGAIYAGNVINATVNGGASIIGRNGSASSFTSIVAYSGASDEVKGTLTSSTAGVIIVGSQTNHPLAVYVNNAEVARWDTSANFQTRVTGTAPSLATNSTMTFELTSNTSLKIFVRGSDGTTRSTTLTLA